MTGDNNAKPVVLNVRLSRYERESFSAKARAYGKVSYVLRELMRAYVDGRLVITPRAIEIQ